MNIDNGVFRRNVPPSFATPNLSGLGQNEEPIWDYSQMTGPSSPDTAVETWLTTGNPSTETGFSSWDWNSIINTATKAGTALLSLEQQRQLSEINLARAQRGQVPLSASQFAPQMNVGLAPDMQKMLMIGGIGLLAVMMLGKRKA